MPCDLSAHITCTLDALQCGAALIDRDGRFAHVNQRLAEICGRDRDAMLAMSVFDLYSDAHALRHLRYILDHFEERTELEFIIERADGSTVPVMIAGRPLDEGDGPPRFRVMTAIEITEQKQAFNEIAKLSDTVLEQARELMQLNASLEQRVRERTEQLHAANLEAITMLAVASEARDEDTGHHVRRIEAYTRHLARRVGYSEQEAEHIGYSAILHDVGKIHIPDHILKKPGRLTDDERRAMQGHTTIGERIVSAQPFFQTARAIARSHHENWDGSGYPDALRGDAIPLPARITHVADVFDALVSKRPYKPAWRPQDALAELQRQSGSMFEPALIEGFRSLYNDGTVAQVLDA